MGHETSGWVARGGGIADRVKERFGDPGKLGSEEELEDCVEVEMSVVSSIGAWFRCR